METAVAVCVPDEVAVGAGVFVMVGRETAVNFESVEELLLVVGCTAATNDGVGFNGTCNKSICDMSSAIITVSITPPVMSKLLRQF